MVGIPTQNYQGPGTGYGTPYSGNTANDALAAYGTMASTPSPATSLAGAAYLNPALAGGDLQLALLRQQYGNLMANQQHQGGYLNQQRGFIDARAGLDQQGLANNRGDLDARGRYLDSQFSTDAQGNNLDLGEVFRQQQLLPEYERMANEAFGLQESDLRRLNLRALEGENSAAVAKGAIGSTGHASSVNDLNSDLRSALSGLGQEKEKTKLSFEQKRLGLQDAADKGALGYKSLENKFQYDKAQLASAQQQLDIEAKKIGINADEARARIQNAIDQLGIGTIADANAILLEMNKVDQGLLSQLPPQILAAIRQLTGLGLAR